MGTMSAQRDLSSGSCGASSRRAPCNPPEAFWATLSLSVMSNIGKQTFFFLSKLAFKKKKYVFQSLNLLNVVLVKCSKIVNAVVLRQRLWQYCFIVFLL